MSKRCIRIPIWIDILALSSVNPNDYKKKYTPKQVLKLSSENGQIRAPGDRFYIGGKRVFARVFIKKK